MKRISSRLTPLNPILVLFLVFGFCIIAMEMMNDSSSIWPMSGAMVGLLLTAGFLDRLAQIKQVWMGDEDLRVGQSGRYVKIPFTDIQSAEWAGKTRLKSIHIVLKRPYRLRKSSVRDFKFFPPLLQGVGTRDQILSGIQGRIEEIRVLPKRGSVFEN